MLLKTEYLWPEIYLFVPGWEDFVTVWQSDDNDRYGCLRLWENVSIDPFEF